MNTELLTRLHSPGPKRILALDGGGIRGCTTLGFLEQIERIVKDRRGNVWRPSSGEAQAC